MELAWEEGEYRKKEWLDWSWWRIGRGNSCSDPITDYKPEVAFLSLQFQL